MKDTRRKVKQIQLYLEDIARTYGDPIVFYGEDPSDENARKNLSSKVTVIVTEWKKSREYLLQARLFSNIWAS